MSYSEESRIPTHIWVEAEVRRLSGEGYGVYVAAKGDRTGGLVLQKVADMGGQCRLRAQQRDLLGKMVWVDVLGVDIVTEAEADAYIRRAVDRDPDLWVVEIEDKGMLVSFGQSIS